MAMEVLQLPTGNCELYLEGIITHPDCHHGFSICCAWCRLLGEARVDSNTQTLMAGEDFAFIARWAQDTCSCISISCSW